MDKNTLLAYQPDYYKDSKVMENINNANAIELNLIDVNLKDTYNQLFVDTANIYLERWEKELGLPIANAYDINYRRTKIYSKKKGQYTITPIQIKNIAESFENGEVEVIEHNSDYYFIIRFTSTKGIPQNLQDLKDAINELKPAHLGVEYEFTFTTWGEVKTITWGSVKTETWGELRTREVI